MSERLQVYRISDVPDIIEHERLRWEHGAKVNRRYSDNETLLLERGAEVSRGDRDNQTPLHLAMVRGRFKLVQVLLVHGADPNAESNNGKTPLHVLSGPWMYNEDDVLNHTRLLLEHGADVNIQDKDNQTPLLLAMVRDRFKLVRVLLEHGADANAESNDSGTPLHILLERRTYCEEEVLNHAQLLLEHGADVNRQDKKNRSPLHLAIGKDWFKLARILLEHGADANADNADGKTPLHLLSESQIHDEGDALDLIQLLVENGAAVTVNKRDRYKQTPLHMAIGRGWFTFAQILLERGADANAGNNNGDTPLHILSERQIYDKRDAGDVLNHTRLWLEHGAEVNRRCKDDETPLLLDIDAFVEKQEGETSVHHVLRGQYGSWGRGVGVAQLPESDVENTQDESQMTSSYLRSKFGPVQTAQALLNHGANVNAGNNGGELEGVHVQNKNHLTPLHLASLYGRLDITRVLLDYGATADLEDRFGRTPLHLVAEGKHNFEQDRVRIARLLLEHGTDANGPSAQNGGNATPLHLASYGGRVAIARLLLDRGAAANSKGNQGRTPLHSVAEGRCLYSEDDGIRVAQLLLERGADVNAPDDDNKTPLNLACYYGAVEIARILLDGGAIVHSTDNQGRTPLHAVAEGEDYYSRNNDVLVAQLSLERGADVNVPDEHDRSPLHLASYVGKVEVVLVLLNAGADANATDANGQTTLHLVSQGSQGDGVSVAQLLLEHGADVNAQDKNQATPLDLASYYHGRTEIASFLLHYGGKSHNEHCPPSTYSLGATVSRRPDWSTSQDSLSEYRSYAN